jgi:uncharacterized protein (UPF0332 family)
VAFANDPTWSIVFRFYAAIHLMQAYLLAKGDARFDASSHMERLMAIKKCTELGRRFEEQYKDLKARSESVRYDPDYAPRAEDYKSSENCLSVIESFLIKKLRDKGADI